MYAAGTEDKPAESGTFNDLKHQTNIVSKETEKLRYGRIIQRNVIYVIGIEESIASESIISSDSFFGQYGEIVHVYLNKKGYVITDEKKTYYSAYITYNNYYSTC